ncbi:MAG: ABC transporter substrate-binding protein [Gemmatimonadaceae bacterium]
MMLSRRFVASGWMAALLSLACMKGDDRSSPRQSPGAGPFTVVDGARDTVRLIAVATRVVSLLPSATDIVTAIDTPSRIVGRTDYDRGPALRAVPSVGGGLDPSIERIVSLSPDLVLYWAGDRSGLRSRLAAAGIASYAVGTRDTADAFKTIADLGVMLGKQGAATATANAIRNELDSVRRGVVGRVRPTVFYAVSTRPPMTAGPHTFISEIIGVAGGIPALAAVAGDWPQISLEQLARAQPDIVILPSTAATGARAADLRRQPAWRALAAVREGRVVEVVEDLMNRPGPRLGEAAREMAKAIASQAPRRPPGDSAIPPRR